MNIKEAKQQIQNAVRAYLTKDAFGDYCISAEKQRPILLIGAPGIGKTAVMEQVAREMGINLVAYSMTHHTRQSAVGLPFIEHRTYDGTEYTVSEYTMSEIIASVYETAEKSGIREGLLFLDEINCVSETLAPAMLQFLQYKVFGRHRIPDGWVVVAAGNPPEYNNSVREFDVATLDRLKKVIVEPDYTVWKEYAYQSGVHGAVLSYLDIKKDHFYAVQSTVEGKSFVTARGWEDLSQMMTLYERLGIPVDEALTAQYIQHPDIARDFAVYYELYKKYKQEYGVETILKGKAEEALARTAGEARFDEKLSLIGMLVDAVSGDIRRCLRTEDVVTAVYGVLKTVKPALTETPERYAEVFEQCIAEQRQAVETARRANTLLREKKQVAGAVVDALEDLRDAVARAGCGTDCFGVVRAGFEERARGLKTQSETVRGRLDALFAFAEQAYGEGQEMLILVTNLTLSPDAARFIATYGCERYYAHNKEALLFERQNDILLKMQKLREEFHTPENEETL
ncbi:ATP-binding protein [Ethanoligenens harbinense]|uniref:ATPase associated with various cellular activities AAA_5 n=1 Tax=Ethanoligenens harbinense (strain DSM 18485 / JCM 12961 / CGMCC 1.5033 / YUAN-3) TaxID=663278 RepID=E6U638_ETHHY|nr:MoxR family ATPase [Ethanoligenens harbinense]ADU25717.1 ATPase associated with various cellular activities AAA_5 [Ethanoligenens harbinense YUAN-3]AVQ94888.1 ATP-binding protein [Ethanoligenens harbinense YUAN-3]AYF37579.1 ATP-binding protein [Ethanoligenens harbinense]AYF40299.1 ATP-binding protein [Ethanoligenens harbinense]QCN91136.1 ATP-binding protein [Ethanoligenens harbinense]